MKLDQRAPKKTSPNTMAKRKKAKMLKEKAKLEELRRQFPTLFSPEKVKSMEQRRKHLVSPSLKKTTSFEESPPVSKENTPENVILNKKPFTSPKAKSIENKGTGSKSQRVLQVLSSPAPKNESSRSRGSFIPSCSCNKKESDGVKAEEDADDVENVQCDICTQIAPIISTQQNVVSALRNYLHKPNMTDTVAVAPVSNTEKGPDSLASKCPESTEPDEEQNQEVIDEGPSITTAEEIFKTNLCSEFDSESNSSDILPPDNEQICDEGAISQPKLEEITDKESVQEPVVTECEKSFTEPEQCFDETIINSLADGRVRGRVVGRKVFADHVEFIYKIQVLKKGFSFEDIEDKEYQLQSPSPSIHAISHRSPFYANGADTTSPYIIQMCILRRYSDFAQLQQTLVSKFRRANIDTSSLQQKFPAKQYLRLFGKRWADPSFLDSRGEGLTEWMNEAIFRKDDLRMCMIEEVHNFISS